MNEIPLITARPAESQNDTSTSHRLVSEVYALNNAKNEQSASQQAYSEQVVAAPHRTAAKQVDGAQKEVYYRLGHNEDEFIRHFAQTWRHIFQGKYTEWEVLEVGIEVIAAAALARYGVKKFWPAKILPPAPVVSRVDDTILSQALTGAQAKNHPIMRMHVRTGETPVFNTR